MTEDLKKALNYFKGDELAASTWKNKYAAEGELTPDDTHKRVSKELFRVENKYSKNKKTSTIHEKSKYGKTRKDLTYDDIYNLLKDFKYVIPGGSILAGLGVKDKLVSLSNCFVIGSPKDSYSGIMKTRSEQVQLMKRRGGVGYDLSHIRPRGSKVNNAANRSTGAASFMEVNSDLTKETSQEGRRKRVLNY